MLRAAWRWHRVAHWAWNRACRLDGEIGERCRDTSCGEEAAVGTLWFSSRESGLPPFDDGAQGQLGIELAEDTDGTDGYPVNEQPLRRQVE